MKPIPFPETPGCVKLSDTYHNSQNSRDLELNIHFPEGWMGLKANLNVMPKTEMKKRDIYLHSDRKVSVNLYKTLLHYTGSGKVVYPNIVICYCSVCKFKRRSLPGQKPPVCIR